MGRCTGSANMIGWARYRAGKCTTSASSHGVYCAIRKCRSLWVPCICACTTSGPLREQHWKQADETCSALLPLCIPEQKHYHTRSTRSPQLIFNTRTCLGLASTQQQHNIQLRRPGHDGRALAGVSTPSSSEGPSKNALSNSQWVTGANRATPYTVGAAARPGPPGVCGKIGEMRWPRMKMAKPLKV